MKKLNEKEIKNKFKSDKNYMVLIEDIFGKVYEEDLALISKVKNFIHQTCLNIESIEIKEIGIKQAPTEIEYIFLKDETNKRKLVGFAAMRYITPFQKHIHLIMVLPEYQYYGIGDYFLDRCLKSDYIGLLSLKPYKEKQWLVDWYVKKGFRQVKENGYYLYDGDGKLDETLEMLQEMNKYPPEQLVHWIKQFANELKGGRI